MREFLEDWWVPVAIIGVVVVIAGLLILNDTTQKPVGEIGGEVTGFEYSPSWIQYVPMGKGQFTTIFHPERFDVHIRLDDGELVSDNSSHWFHHTHVGCRIRWMKTKGCFTSSGYIISVETK